MSVQTFTSGTPIVWADSADYVATVSGFTRTAQIDLTSIASTKARQGARVDLTANRPPYLHVMVGLEYAVAPATTALAQLYFVFMPNATVLPAGISGSDGAYKDAEELEWVRQAGVFVPLNLTADATPVIQHIDCGLIVPLDRYVVPILLNSGGQALHSDAVEMYIAAIPQGIDNT